MDINPEKTYSHLQLVGYRVVWTIDGPLSADLIAGLMLGIYVAYTDMVKQLNQLNHPIREETSIYIFDPDEEETEYSMTIDDIPGEALQQYITERAEVDLLDTTKFYGTFDTFFVWILDPETDSYFLVDFTNPSFIQGFISITRAFGVDFRNYVYGPPFKVRDGEKEFYQIQGYEINQ